MTKIVTQDAYNPFSDSEFDTLLEAKDELFDRLHEFSNGDKIAFVDFDNRVTEFVEVRIEYKMLTI